MGEGASALDSARLGAGVILVCAREKRDGASGGPSLRKWGSVGGEEAGGGPSGSARLVRVRYSLCMSS